MNKKHRRSRFYSKRERSAVFMLLFIEVLLSRERNRGVVDHGVTVIEGKLPMPMSRIPKTVLNFLINVFHKSVKSQGDPRSDHPYTYRGDICV